MLFNSKFQFLKREERRQKKSNCEKMNNDDAHTNAVVIKILAKYPLKANFNL